MLPTPDTLTSDCYLNTGYHLFCSQTNNFLSQVTRLTIFTVNLQRRAATQTTSVVRLVHRTARAQNCSCTELLVHRTARAQNCSCTELLVHRTARAQNGSCTELLVHRTARACVTSLTPLVFSQWTSKHVYSRTEAVLSLTVRAQFVPILTAHTQILSEVGRSPGNP